MPPPSPCVGRFITSTISSVFVKVRRLLWPRPNRRTDLKVTLESKYTVSMEDHDWSASRPTESTKKPGSSFEETTSRDPGINVDTQSMLSFGDSTSDLGAKWTEKYGEHGQNSTSEVRTFDGCTLHYRLRFSADPGRLHRLAVSIHDVLLGLF